MSLNPKKAIAYKSNYDLSVLQNPCFKVFSCTDPKVEKVFKKISKAVGQEGDIACQEV